MIADQNFYDIFFTFFIGEYKNYSKKTYKNNKKTLQEKREQKILEGATFFLTFFTGRYLSLL
jgi:cyclopropane fatty-acyl-phospholipid synthase-like methyltransferase